MASVYRREPRVSQWVVLGTRAPLLVVVDTAKAASSHRCERTLDRLYDCTASINNYATCAAETIWRPSMDSRASRFQSCSWSFLAGWVRKSLLWGCLTACVALSGCVVGQAASFTVPPERANECRDICKQPSMQMSAVVVISNMAGCVCEPIRPQSGSASATGPAAASGGAAIAVAQAIAAQQAAQQQQQMRR